MSDNINVCVRVRPADEPTGIWKLEDRVIEDGDKGKKFHFTAVFKPEHETVDLYERMAEPVVSSVMRGFNGTMFAYGQTCSGKTHTIMGTRSNPGVIPLAVQQIFDTIEKRPNIMFLLRASYMEIYNEQLNDLLDLSKKSLKIREKDGCFTVPELTDEIVTCPEDVMKLIEKGTLNRSVGVSNLNEHSSRSHSIFRMIIESTNRVDEGTGEAAECLATCEDCEEDAATVSCLDCKQSFCADCNELLHKSPKKRKHTRVPATSSKAKPGSSKASAGVVRVAELNLVDLAGSETMTYAFDGKQRSETKAINLSLTQLKTVITSLSKKEKFVPFRNSVLTKILRNSLGGNSKTTVICKRVTYVPFLCFSPRFLSDPICPGLSTGTMSPANVHHSMSASTLHFGQMAIKIKNEAKVNETGDDNSKLKEYKAQILRMEAKLHAFDQLQQEKLQMQKEYEKLAKQVEEMKAKEAEQEKLQTEIGEMSRKVVGGERYLGRQQSQVSMVDVKEMEEVQSQLEALREANLKMALQLQDKEKSSHEQEEQVERMRAMEMALEAQYAEKDKLSKQLEEQNESRQTEEERIKRHIQELQQELQDSQKEKQAMEEDLKHKTRENMRSVTAQVKEEMEKVELDLLREREEKDKLLRQLQEQQIAKDKIQSDVKNEIAAYNLQLQEEIQNNAKLAAQLRFELAEKTNAENDLAARMQETERLLQSERTKSEQQATERDRLLREKEQAADEMKQKFDLANSQIQKERDHAARRESELEKLRAAHKDKEVQLAHLQQKYEANLSSNEAHYEGHIQKINRDIKNSGMDRDHYLAVLLEEYDQQLFKLKGENQELLSLNEALKLDSDEKVNDLQRKLASPARNISSPVKSPKVTEKDVELKQLREEVHNLRACERSLQAKADRLEKETQIAKSEAEAYRLQLNFQAEDAAEAQRRSQLVQQPVDHPLPAPQGGSPNFVAPPPNPN